MRSTRFLLPFVQDIDLGALRYAVQFARRRRATLVPVALIPLTERQWAKGPRLEAIEQANDFLEAVKEQARRAGVPIESSARETRNVEHSIILTAQEFLCAGIFLFLRNRTSVLLPPCIIAHLLEHAPCSLCLVRLAPTARGKLGALLHTWFSHLRTRRPGRDKTVFSPNISAIPVGELITILPVQRATPLPVPE